MSGRFCTILFLFIRIFYCVAFLIPVQCSGQNKKKIVFQSDASGNKDIYTMDIDGSGLCRLTQTKADNLYPSWSPDGKRIVFSSDRDCNSEIYIMDSDGGNQTRLTESPARDICPSWHPDGKRIIFTSDRDGTMNFYLMGADGKGTVKITDFSKGENDMAHISPDGKEVVFTSNMALGWQVFAIGMDGQGLRRLTGLPYGHCEGIWMRNSNRMLFVSRLYTGNSEICIMDTGGDNKRTLTDNKALDYNPRFLPDDSQIVFISNRDGNWEIYLMDQDGCNTVRLTHTGSNEEWPDIFSCPDEK
jgi:Tol biopolymer transport system component